MVNVRGRISIGALEFDQCKAEVLLPNRGEWQSRNYKRWAEPWESAWEIELSRKPCCGESPVPPR